MADEHEGPVKVTVSCPTTGKILEEKVISNDFLVVVAGNRYIKHIQYMGKTCVLSVAVKK